MLPCAQRFAPEDVLLAFAHHMGHAAFSVRQGFVWTTARLFALSVMLAHGLQQERRHAHDAILAHGRLCQEPTQSQCVSAVLLVHGRLLLHRLLSLLALLVMLVRTHRSSACFRIPALAVRLETFLLPSVHQPSLIVGSALLVHTVLFNRQLAFHVKLVFILRPVKRRFAGHGPSVAMVLWQ